MEESEKRRERLRAMRMEAASSDINPPQQEQRTPITTNSNLANPLLDHINNNQQQETSRTRFDFYTDPLAAFSSNRRPPSPYFPPSPYGPRNSEMSHSGVHQFQNNYAPHQSNQQGGDPSYSPVSIPSPMGVRSPYQGYQARDPFYRPGPNAGPMGPRGPYPGHQGSPSFSSAPYRSPQFYHSPSPGSGFGGSPYPVHQGSTNFVPQPQGRGHWSNNSPSPGRGYGGRSPGSGRGMGGWEGSGYSGGRGRGRGQTFDAQARSYYDKSMVEDPWQSLSPVIWQSDDDGVSFTNSWGAGKMSSDAKKNRGSVNMTSSSKKARVSNITDKSSSEPSLAEFLASIADEAESEDTPAV